MHAACTIPAKILPTSFFSYRNSNGVSAKYNGAKKNIASDKEIVGNSHMLLGRYQKSYPQLDCVPHVGGQSDHVILGGAGHSAPPIVEGSN